MFSLLNWNNTKEATINRKGARVAKTEDDRGRLGRITNDKPFSSPEPPVSLSLWSLGHEEQVAQGTHDLIG